MRTFRRLIFPNPTLRRLNLLVERDRLLAQVHESPHTMAWVDACAALALVRRQLDDLAKAA